MPYKLRTGSYVQVDKKIFTGYIHTSIRFKKGKSLKKIFRLHLKVFMCHLMIFDVELFSPNKYLMFRYAWRWQIYVGVKGRIRNLFFFVWITVESRASSTWPHNQQRVPEPRVCFFVDSTCSTNFWKNYQVVYTISPYFTATWPNLCIRSWANKDVREHWWMEPAWPLPYSRARRELAQRLWVLLIRP